MRPKLVTPDKGAVWHVDYAKGSAPPSKARERLTEKAAKTHQTTRGPRRLSFQEAYSRRTTPTSQQRVLELYGRTKPPASEQVTLTRPGGPAGSFGSGPKRELKPTTDLGTADQKAAREDQLKRFNQRLKRSRPVARI